MKTSIRTPDILKMAGAAIFLIAGFLTWYSLEVPQIGSDDVVAARHRCARRRRDFRCAHGVVTAAPSRRGGVTCRVQHDSASPSLLRR